MTFRIGSLFSGIGGLELGLERAIVGWLMGFPKGYKRREKLKAFGNAVVPQVAEIVGRRVAEVLQ